MAAYQGTAGDDRLAGGAGADDFDISAGGADRVWGGAGADTIWAEEGLTAADRIEGGEGFDTLYFDVGEGGADLVLSLVTGIEQITIRGQYEDAMSLRLADRVGAAGGVLQVYASFIGDIPFAFDGSAERDARLSVISGYGADRLAGGRRGDTLDAGIGEDVLIGGRGADVLAGRQGADVFLYRALEDSTARRPDLIYDLEAGDVVDLSAIDADAGVAGDQAFRLVGALSGRAGEALLSYDGAITRLALDADGDAKVDALVALNGDQTAFEGWVL